MSGTSIAQHEWVRTVLGFDVEAAMAKGTQVGATQDGSEQGKDPNGELDEKHGLFEFAKRKAQAAVVELLPPPTDKELAAALKALDDQISAVETLGFDVKRLKVDRNDCASASDKAEKLTDDTRAKALKSAKKRIEDLTKHAASLAASAKSVMGKSKDAPTAVQKSKIYQKALEDHYGIKIENKDNMDNTHLDRVFDMFGTVPVDDADQDKLSTLKYDKASKGGGAYSRTELYVKMGDFGDATGQENYEIDGEVMPVNSFDVTTLHEIGHAVDNKHGFMTSNRSKTGCGGWKSETVDTIAAEFLKDLKATAALSDKAADPDLLAAIKTALSAGTTAKPAKIEQPDWEKVADFLTNKVLKCRAANQPWYRGAPVVGGRVYQEAYGGQWWSYDDAAKAATKVNGYQWRAPGEWFAEVYAITWMKKKKPPAGVDSAAAIFMWNG